MLLERPGEGDWERWRELRLRMLADTPSAYAETLQTALGHDESAWRFRVRRTHQPGCLTLVAVEEATGRWIGTMGAFTDPRQGPFLVSVFVDPAHRGTGVADHLLDEVVRWARAVPAVTGMVLHVHEQNLRAQAFYRRRGFRGTGVWMPYSLDPSQRELEMRMTFDEPGPELP